MTATAVVTGSAARVDDVAQAIEDRGIVAFRIDRSSDVAHAGAALASGSLEYYIQLPDDVPSPQSTTAGALAALSAGLMRRFTEVDMLLPKLAPHCSVVLVTGETVEDLPWMDYPHGPTCLLEMLAAAIVTDLSPAVVRTTVVSHEHSAARIADLAVANGAGRATVTADYASRAPEMPYDDWKLACLSASGPVA
jgi:hypothetical protein